MKRTVLSLAAMALALSLGTAARADDTPASGAATTAPAPAAEAKPMHHAHHKSMGAKTTSAVDLNSATKDELMALPGITDEAAEKIIAARPFTMRAELVKKSVVTKAEYSKIKGKVTVKKAS